MKELCFFALPVVLLDYNNSAMNSILAAFFASAEFSFNDLGLATAKGEKSGEIRAEKAKIGKSSEGALKSARGEFRQNAGRKPAKANQKNCQSELVSEYADFLIPNQVRNDGSSIQNDYSEIKIDGIENQTLIQNGIKRIKRGNQRKSKSLRAERNKTQGGGQNTTVSSKSKSRRCSQHTIKVEIMSMWTKDEWKGILTTAIVKDVVGTVVLLAIFKIIELW